jgi:tetratricopeptide (TPR) repeat protein
MEALLRRERQRKHNGHAANGSGCVGCAQMKDLGDLDILFGCPLEFELVLINVIPATQVPRNSWELSRDEQCALALTKKTEGDTLYRSGAYQSAIDAYQSALTLIYLLAANTRDEDASKRDELALKCQLNLAACYLKIHDYTQVIRFCSEVLTPRTPLNPKALFRRGQAYRLMGRDFDAAKRDFELCLLADASTRNEVEAELKLMAAQQRDADSELFRNILT